MARRWSGPEHRQSPRIDVLRRVHGRLTALETPIEVHDLSAHGFAIVSELSFPPGQTLDFRLTGPDNIAVSVAAESVHTRPLPNAPHLYFSGFRFVPGGLTGQVPRILIERLIETVAGPMVSLV